MTWIRTKEEFTNPVPTAMFPILLPLKSADPTFANQAAWRGGRKEETPESGYERVQKVFRIQGAEVSQEPLAPSETSFAPVQPHPFCTSARGFSLPGSNRPFAPSPNHFGEFPIFDPLPHAAWLANLGGETDPVHFKGSSRTKGMV